MNETPDPTEETLLPGRKPPGADPWLEHARVLEQEAPTRYEEAAKHLATLVGVGFSLFLVGDIAWVGKLPAMGKGAAFFCLLFWVVSVSVSLFVLAPSAYRFSNIDGKSVREAMAQAVGRKRMWFCTAALCYLVGLVGLVGLFIWSTGFRS